MTKKRIYLAGPLFCIADRLHNLTLSIELEKIGYTVTLPQKEVLKWNKGRRLDLTRVAQECMRGVKNCDYFLANIDGSDADSGTAVEFGLALSTLSNPKPFVICFRTDVRTDPLKETGFNAMFRLADRVIFKPANVNNMKDVRKFYADLAAEIHSSIRQLEDSRQAVP